MQTAVGFFLLKNSVAAHEVLASVRERGLEPHQSGRERLRLSTTFLEQVRKGALDRLTKRIGQRALLGHDRVAVHDGHLGVDHMLPGLRRDWHREKKDRDRPRKSETWQGCGARLCHGRTF